MFELNKSQKTILCSIKTQSTFCCFCCHHHHQGKTNKNGLKIYGRAIRHKTASLCPVGAFAFYLAFRFSVTKEFEEYDLLDWKTNSKWFDIKLLIDSTNFVADRTANMKNDTYSKAVRTVLQELGIKSTHWVHLGRVTGPKMLEMEEIPEPEIKRLGNWDQKVYNKCYSGKLPMQPMRSIGGFHQAKGMYFNPRTTAKPPIELVLQTPFKFAVINCDLVWESIRNNNSAGSTAHTFLKLCKELAVVFLQDAAAIWIENPERRDHPLFTLDVFQSQEWKVRVLCFYLSVQDVT